jgi:hypothetical protein
MISYIQLMFNNDIIQSHFSLILYFKLHIFIKPQNILHNFSLNKLTKVMLKSAEHFEFGN